MQAISQLNLMLFKNFEDDIDDLFHFNIMGYFV